MQISDRSLICPRLPDLVRIVLDKSAKVASTSFSVRRVNRIITFRPSVTISSADAAVIWDNRYVFAVESNDKKNERLVVCAVSEPWLTLVVAPS